MTETFNSAPLLEQTRHRFPGLEKAEITIKPIEKGGSDRRFYRVRANGDEPLILVKYNLEREENRHYARIAQFLSDREINAPKIYFHDAVAGLVWLEDLGEKDLWSYRTEDWLVRRPLYESALEQADKLHRLPASAVDKVRSELQPDFDIALYQWEQDYFFEHCLGRHFGMEEKLCTELQQLPALRQIAEELAGLPRVLVHRDFNSQNLIVRAEQAYLIDFQGMRLGLAEYDLASLLYDPYVALSPDQRGELLAFYPRRDGADEIFRRCAMQRLMQALGAYGFLGLVRGNRAFLEHIPAAMKSLRAVLEQMPSLDRLSEALQSLSLNGEDAARV